MVTFKDLKDPKSVIEVNRHNLSETFGEGINLQKVTIEMTDEDVTYKVDEYLSGQFWTNFDNWWKKLEIEQKSKKAHLFNSLKIGELQ